MLKTTPFHVRTAALAASHAWRRWAGYVVASSYELSHDREYHAIRSAAALLDVSPLFKYLVSGRDAARCLNRIVTRDVMKLEPGRVIYTTWCNGAGKVIDDGTIARLDERRYRMTSAEPGFRWLHDNAIGLDVAIEDVSSQTAALALQGPLSRVVLGEVAGDEAASLGYFSIAHTRIAGADVTVSRTGYTGDLGYEIWLDANDALPVWDALVQAGRGYGITPAGILALDIARIEAGLMLLDVDYVSARKALVETQMSTPYELDLGWSVDLKKESFVGREVLSQHEARNPEWRFVGVEVDWDSLERLYAQRGLAPQLPHTAWRSSVPIYRDDRQVGYATSGTWSPLLKKYIALAHLERKAAEAGSELEMELTVEHRRRRARARVVKKPFFDPERKRA